MNFHAEISVESDGENILKLFNAEDKEFMNKRSKYQVKKEGNGAVFEISAEDATALRATLDSIAKALKVYEDMKEIK